MRGSDAVIRGENKVNKWTAGALALVSFLGCGGAEAQTQKYSVTLQTAPFPVVYVGGIDNSGNAAGYVNGIECCDSSFLGRVPYIWSPSGQARALATNNFAGGQAGAFNGVEQILGVEYTGESDFFPDGVIWTHGVPTDIGNLGGGASYPAAFNDAGAVVGQSQMADGSLHAFIWQHGHMTDLGNYFAVQFLNGSIRRSGYVDWTGRELIRFQHQRFVRHSRHIRRQPAQPPRIALFACRHLADWRPHC
jgi:probable HAF family extracellular repeat protein